MTRITALALLLAATTASAQSGAALGTWGVETQYINQDIRPGDDFYRYVNDGWLKTAKIPQGLPLNGAFLQVALRAEQQVKAIIEELRDRPRPPGSPAQQIHDLHASYTDLERRNALGMSMLREEFDGILKASSRSELARRMGRIGYEPLFDFGVDRDLHDPTRYLFAVGQGGLGLPSRDYYLKKEEPYASLRKAYAGYIEDVFVRAGVPGARRKAQAILAFETAVARRHWTATEERDVVKMYDKQTLPKLLAYAPGFDWQALLGEAGFGDVDQLIVATNTAVKKVAALYAGTPLATLRAYVAFRYLDGHAHLLSQDWVDARFDFYSRKLTGIAEQRPLDVRAVRFLNGTLGEQLGRLYVERHFPAESRQAMATLLAYLRQAFRERLAANAWMDAPTRQAALDKLEAFTAKVGAPERWHDYGRVRIDAADLVGNVHRLEQWAVEDARAKLRGPVRDWEWGMTPQTVNAYYRPSANEIVFPAAILQPPFFDPRADPAANFGAIGAVIGHEMGHGFDDQGSRFDGQGRLREWWSKASRRQFEARAARLAAQFSRYEPLPGLKLDGRQTLGENLGDLGGLTVAFAAYRRFAAEESKGHVPLLDGFTGEQRFFLAFAQLWRSIETEAYTRQAVLSDTHSPDAFRVNGSLRNFDPWYAAFGVGKDAKLYLSESERVSLW